MSMILCIASSFLEGLLATDETQIKHGYGMWLLEWCVCIGTLSLCMNESRGNLQSGMICSSVVHSSHVLGIRVSSVFHLWLSRFWGF